MRGVALQLFNMILVAELLFGVGLVLWFGFYSRRTPQARPLTLAGITLVVMGAALLFGNRASDFAVPASFLTLAASGGAVSLMLRGSPLRGNGLLFPTAALVAGLALMFFAQGRISQEAMAALMGLVGLTTAWFIISAFYRVFNAASRHRTER